ncbi:hypothetical protein MUK42_28596 [Musa troglodytarum]|uniref:Uncharacterized protein n=1 Tax=Musa troglodytarum TaxID=320322 RepID=A0A9E7FK46_9LILI|nr:hypothetical protein MUK42_28596 [Musa troglodytarum]
MAFASFLASLDGALLPSYTLPSEEWRGALTHLYWTEKYFVCLRSERSSHPVRCGEHPQALFPLPRLLSPVGCVPRPQSVGEVRHLEQGQVSWSRVGPIQGTFCFPALLERDERRRRVSIYRV